MDVIGNGKVGEEIILNYQLDYIPFKAIQHEYKTQKIKGNVTIKYVKEDIKEEDHNPEVKNAKTLQSCSARNKLVKLLLEEGKISEAISVLDDQIKNIQSLEQKYQTNLTKYFLSESEILKQKILSQGNTPTVAKTLHHIGYGIDRIDYNYVSSYVTSYEQIGDIADKSKNVSGYVREEDAVVSGSDSHDDENE